MEADRRDPAFIARNLPLLAAPFDRYHRVEVGGIERVPNGAALVVGNHNGGSMAPDMFALMVAYWRRFGVEAPAYGLMHDVMFHVPVVGETMAKLGAVPARPEHAIELLERGAKVLVYPGGDIDAFKPSAKKHEIVFGSRVGFVRVALRTGAPIVPVVSIGAHDAFHVVADGQEFARRSGWKRLTRIEVFPVILSFPFGLSVGPMFGYWPLPVRMKLRVLDPIRWPHLDAKAADDRETLLRCREDVRRAMQRAVDEMVAEGGFGRRPIREVLRDALG